jgi:hypothetical protein
MFGEIFSHTPTTFLLLEPNNKGLNYMYKGRTGNLLVVNIAFSNFLHFRNFLRLFTVIQYSCHYNF